MLPCDHYMVLHRGSRQAVMFTVYPMIDVIHVVLPLLTRR